MTRQEARCGSGPDLPVAAHNPFIGCQPFKCDRPARVKTTRGNPDFGTQPKLAAIGNITSDGRPILGLDCEHLLEMVLEADERGVLLRQWLR